MSTTAIPATDLANVSRLQILAHQAAGNTIAQVILRLPPDVQKFAADEILFIWLPRGESCSFSLDAKNVSSRRYIVCLTSQVADMPLKAQMAVIVDEIARAFLGRVFVPADGPERSRPAPNNSEVQKLVSSWGFWK